MDFNIWESHSLFKLCRFTFGLWPSNFDTLENFTVLSLVRLYLLKYSRQNTVTYCFEFMIPTLALGVYALTWLFWAGLSKTRKHISVWHKETNLAENLAAVALIPGVKEQSFSLITSCSKPYPSSPLPKWQWRVALVCLNTHIDISAFLKISNFSKISDKTTAIFSSSSH